MLSVLPIAASGASAAHQVLSHLFGQNRRDRPALVICASEDLADDLEVNLEALQSTFKDIPFAISRFPGWDHTPYSPISPALSTRIQRLRCLADLHFSRQSRIIVTSVAALTQRTLPKQVFEKESIGLETGQIIESREWLRNCLNSLGYDPADPVEDPGTYALRGEIIDVFPLSLPHPVRIELYDTMIEKMRIFDPVSQRVSSPEIQIPILKLTPAREVLIHRGTVDNLATQIKEFCDTLGISRRIRDPIVEQIRDQRYPEHADAWVPFAYANPETLLDQSPFQSISMIEPERCKAAFTEFLTEQIDHFEKRDHQTTIVPPPDLLFESLPERLSFKSSSTEEESPQSTPVIIDPIKREKDSRSLEKIREKIKSWIESNVAVHLFSPSKTQLDRIQFLLNLEPLTSKFIHYHLGEITDSFEITHPSTVFLAESTLFGKKVAKKKSFSQTSRDQIQLLNALREGDLVVHIQHGLARYTGMTRLMLQGIPTDFLALEYANQDRFYLPIYRLDSIQKYQGGSSEAKLDRLGGKNFEKAKEKVRKSVRELAFNLVELYARRALQVGFKTASRGDEYREFESAFPFDETPDQLKATEDIFSDLESGKILDRLVCGDVGFGKTEVAMRTAFQMILSGKQVAVLVPTTLLAFQHEQTFRNRFKKFPVSIASVSRLKTSSEIKDILQQTKEGKVDLLIGTHRLLSSDVEFKSLGLMIVDEEHRFGVEHKEKLKTLALDTHVLTLTATPIPRTLHMALAGVRDISLMTTPPVNRMPVRTFVAAFDWETVKKAIETEMRRGGQIYFLHNQVVSIEMVARKIRELIPQCRVGIGHGQMGEKELEQVMFQFYQKEIDLLVCTTIIESGLDVPNANTLIVDRADQLGLAQLYQIRGRVGRSDQRAFAYLFVSETGKLTDDARKRLDVIQRFVELGSGYSIASYDLEIRGGGNLLGAEQSGHIASIGFELYSEMLEEAIQEVRGKPLALSNRLREPEIKSPFSAYLDEKYAPDSQQRLAIYRRLSAANDESSLIQMETEISERFGPLPVEAQQLIWLIRIKILLRKLGVKTAAIGDGRVTVQFFDDAQANPQALMALMKEFPGQIRITPESKVLFEVGTQKIQEIFEKLEKLLGSLVS